MIVFMMMPGICEAALTVGSKGTLSHLRRCQRWVRCSFTSSGLCDTTPTVCLKHYILSQHLYIEIYFYYVLSITLIYFMSVKSFNSLMYSLISFSSQSSNASVSIRFNVITFKPFESSY